MRHLMSLIFLSNDDAPEDTCAQTPDTRHQNKWDGIPDRYTFVLALIFLARANKWYKSEDFKKELGYVK